MLLTNETLDPDKFRPREAAHPHRHTIHDPVSDSNGPLWQPLVREAALIAEHLAIGATAIGRANFERTADYAQAFFALSVGFERGCKLALSLHAAVGSGGQFLSSRELRTYGHNLPRLLAAVVDIAERRSLGASLPETDVHRGIIATLADFATNVTRYYNLEALASDALDETPAEDPIAQWHSRVTQPVLQAHYSQRQRELDRRGVQPVTAQDEIYFFVDFRSEGGEPIRSVGDLRRSSAEARIARRWERMYVLQLARFLGQVIGKLGSIAQADGLEIPFLYEFFEIFQADDQYFRERTTWSIHRR